MVLPVSVEQTLEAALRKVRQAAVRKDRRDLLRWQRREFGLVAGEQYPLAILLAKTVRNMTLPALAAILRCGQSP